METHKISRRNFIEKASIGTATVMTTMPAFGFYSRNAGNLAINGGQPVRTEGWYEWPIWDKSAESDISSVLRSGVWCRLGGSKVSEFEKKYAQLMGAGRCLATASGTTALLTAMHVLGIDAGDEVLVSPYTFIATYNVIFHNKALPVFVDTDQETFTMNPAKIEERITERTKAIIPVHILGLPCDMDRINSIAKKHDLVVIEDACQAWLAEYRGKKCGTLADLGCFSFQNSKNLPAGEGGAVLGSNDEIMDRCFSYHNCGRAYGSMKADSRYPVRGTNFRMQEFQAVILMSQMERILKDADTRLENARYLDLELREIPGIIPYKLSDGATRSAYHLYPFRYKKEYFNDAPRDQFLKALRAEGIPCSGGYGPQNKDGLVEEAISSRGFQRLFSKERLQRYREENVLPDNDQLCEEAVWFSQSMLLGSRKDMEQIVEAISKIQKNADQLEKA